MSELWEQGRHPAQAEVHEPVQRRDETDVERERRLLREARSMRLGSLDHSRLGESEGPVERVRVEVSFEDGEGEHCGFFVVRVPSISAEGCDEAEALALHPATLASEAVNEYLDREGWSYASIDDVFPDGTERDSAKGTDEPV